MEPFSDADIKRKKRKEFPWEEKDISLPPIGIRDLVAERKKRCTSLITHLKTSLSYSTKKWVSDVITISKDYYEDLVSSINKIDDLRNKMMNPKIEYQQEYQKELSLLQKKVYSTNPFTFTDIANIIRKDRNLTEFIKNAPLRLAEEVPLADQSVIFIITGIKKELEADLQNM